MPELAPIGVSTYIRLGHLEKTITALKNNILARKSHLFVFSDGPKPGDEDKVKKVRDYLQTIDGFKDISILEREENSRIKNNRGGMRQLLSETGKCIFLEEDVITAPGFLSFINQGLEYYKDDKRIISISGHTPNLKLYDTYTNDIYAIDRFHGWGFGIWEDRYNLINYIPEYKEIKKNEELIKRLESVGNDMIPMIKREASRKIDALDIKACYLMALTQMITILPVKTLVKNIGLDGTGTHSGKYNPYLSNSLSIESEFSFRNDISIDHLIKEQYKHFYTKSFIDTYPDKIRRLIGLVKLFYFKKIL